MGSWVMRMMGRSSAPGMLFVPLRASAFKVGNVLTSHLPTYPHSRVGLRRRFTWVNTHVGCYAYGLGAQFNAHALGEESPLRRFWTSLTLVGETLWVYG